MRKLPLMGSVLAVALLSGCTSLGGYSQSRASSSLVDFLYPDGGKPPQQDSIPELKLPLRVGLAFLPSGQEEPSVGLEAARREALLERIRARFADRKFVAGIVVIPDYYLRSGRGFDGLESIQRLYGVDVLGLVSYDQVSYRDENSLSLGYLTIVGAYVLKGNRHDVTTLMDLAIVDPVSRSLMLRAGGTDTRHGTTTLVGESRATRESQAEGYAAATDRLIENFDAALIKFEADVKAGKASVRVAHRNDGGGGGGSSDPSWLALLGILVVLACRREPLNKSPAPASRQAPPDASSARAARALELRRRTVELLVFPRRAKAHHVVHARAVVPAAVEQHDLACGGQMHRFGRGECSAPATI